MDASARVTMKDAANCDKQCELQNSVNHQISERTLRSRVFLRACLVSASDHKYFDSVLFGMVVGRFASELA